jgi:hypothetical protein
LIIIESKYSYYTLYELNEIFEIKNVFTYHLVSLHDDLNQYIYYSNEIPILTNCILASSYLNEILGYSNLENDEKRNFIKNILLKEFYSTHSILIYQIIFNLWYVVNDYKNFNNNLIKLKSDGTYSDLPDYDERFFMD